MVPVTGWKGRELRQNVLGDCSYVWICASSPTDDGSSTSHDILHILAIHQNAVYAIAVLSQIKERGKMFQVAVLRGHEVRGNHVGNYGIEESRRIMLSLTSISMMCKCCCNREYKELIVMLLKEGEFKDLCLEGNSTRLQLQSAL